MPKIPQKAPVYPAKKRRLKAADWTLIRWLVLMFPMGLLMMWSSHCKWPARRKGIITALVLLVPLLVFLPATAPKPLPKGGVRVVSVSGQGAGLKDVMGPEVPEDLHRFSPPILMREYQPDPDASPSPSPTPEPTPTPKPKKVYINEGGKYYHTKSCKYTYHTTPKFDLTAEIAAEYGRCPDCKPPKFKGGD